MYCANHPKVETAVSCSNCGKPICPDCMVMAPVGIKCRDCARQPRSARVTPAPGQGRQGGAAALLTGSGLGILLAYAGYQGLGFFTLIVAYIVGPGGRSRDASLQRLLPVNSTGWIAASGAAWSYICAAIVIAAHVGGNLRLYVQVLGLLLAAIHRLSRVVVSPPTQKKRGRAARTFAFGTLVGGVIAVAAPRLRRGLQPGAQRW